jgi:hypothetical protein
MTRAEMSTAGQHPMAPRRVGVVQVVPGLAHAQDAAPDVRGLVAEANGRSWIMWQRVD